MKKNLFLILAIVLMTAASSCKSSSSFENDVKKRAEYMCKIQQLTVKAATDEKAAKDLDTEKKALEQYDKDMEKKYKDMKMDDKKSEQSRKIIDGVMANCK